MIPFSRGSKILLIANIIVFAVAFFLQKFQNFDLTHYLGLYYVKSSYFHPYQYFTYMFMHAGFMHIFFNMYALFMFGTIIERVWGTKRFMFYYLVTGIGAAVVNTLVNYWQFAPISDALDTFLTTPTASTLEALTQKCDNFNLPAVYEIIDHWNEFSASQGFYDQLKGEVVKAVSNYVDVPMVGASGAVFGLLLAFAVLFPDMELQIIFIPIGIKAKYFVLLYGLAELFFGINDFSGDNVAHWAHLGGLLVGIVLILIWRRYPGNSFFNK